MRARTDLTGRQFGQWTVKSYVGLSGKSPMWLCSCDCGRDRPVQGSNLRSGRSTGCGCHQAQKSRLARRA